MTRAEGWPEGLRFIARRVKPSRRHLKNLTDYEGKTGWKYSITCTNVPNTGIGGVPGSHHPQWIDTLHRDHATVETDGVRTAKAMGLRNLPSKIWLVSQLSASTAKDIILLTHMPAYDPHPVANSQFSDRYEAQMYEQIAETYQRTHPDQHVILLFGHARGVAEQILDPDGTSDPNGLPNFTVADAGVAPYATVDQGGFYNYALFHILPDGTIQFAIQPVLDSIAVTAPQPSLARGATEQLTATGTTPTGDDLAAQQVPIADPASHVWSSSDPAVAAVDPSTGQLTAKLPGTAIISVTSGGLTGTVTVTVTK
jgi:hypothetical protein